MKTKFTLDEVGSMFTDWTNEHHDQLLKEHKKFNKAETDKVTFPTFCFIIFTKVFESVFSKHKKK